MATAASFEDLIAWQKARILARDIYLATRASEFSRDFGLVTQIQRAAVSVMANLAEGFERRRTTEFYRYVEISKGSCAGVLSHLYVAQDVGYLSTDSFATLKPQVEDLQRILGGLRNSLAASRNSELGTRNS